MAEPATTSSSIGIYAVFILLFGQMAGPYALILVSSLAGGLWTVGKAQTSSKRAAAWLLLKTTLAACVLTTGIAYLVESIFGWPIIHLLAPVAFLIGFGGEDWYTIVKTQMSRLNEISIKR